MRFLSLKFWQNISQNIKNRTKPVLADKEKLNGYISFRYFIFPFVVFSHIILYLLPSFWAILCMWPFQTVVVMWESECVWMIISEFGGLSICESLSMALCVCFYGFVCLFLARDDSYVSSCLGPVLLLCLFLSLSECLCLWIDWLPLWWNKYFGIMDENTVVPKMVSDFFLIL